MKPVVGQQNRRDLHSTLAALMGVLLEARPKDDAIESFVGTGT